MITALKMVTLFGGRSYEPDQTAGLVLWHRSDFGLFTDTDGTTPSTADGAVVANWTDKQTALAFVQATETKQPSLQNGSGDTWNNKPVVSFDGGDLLRVANTVTTATSGTLFAVVSIDNRTGDVTVLGSFDESTATIWWILRVSSGLLKITQRNADTEDRVVGTLLLSAGKPHIVTVQSSGTAWTLSLDGAAQTLTAQSGSNGGDWFGDCANRDNFVLGAFKASSEAQFLAGDEAEVILYDAVLTASQIRRVEDYLVSRYGISLVVFDGNSMTLGTGSTAGNDYPLKTIDALTGNYAHQNFGVSAQTTAQMASDAATQIDPLYSSSRPKNIVVPWEITNDLYGGGTAADAYGRYVAYCQARRAAGWRVVAVTVLPRSNSGTPVDFETSRWTVNTSIRNNYATFADALADVAANTDIGEAGDSDNATYYTDKVHMTDAGYLIVAGIVASAIATL